MIADLAWQRQQLFGHFERQPVLRHVFGDRASLEVLAFAAFEIGPEPPAFESDAIADLARPFTRRRLAALSERTGKLALGIVGAGDECAIFAAAKPQLPGAAQRAKARVAAVALVGEQPGSQELVERRCDVRRLLLHHFAGLGLEVLPEGFEQILPAGAPARHIVEPVFKLGGVVVVHIAFEEALEKGGDQAATFLGNEARLVELDVVAVLQRLERRGVGRRAADAEFLQPLDQACLGVARQRLGETLHRIDRTLARRIAGLEQRHPGRLVIIGLVVPALLVKREETGEECDLPGRPQGRPSSAIA